MLGDLFQRGSVFLIRASDTELDAGGTSWLL
jgi:hypothetical protein